MTRSNLSGDRTEPRRTAIRWFLGQHQHAHAPMCQGLERPQSAFYAPAARPSLAAQKALGLLLHLGRRSAPSTTSSAPSVRRTSDIAKAARLLELPRQGIPGAVSPPLAAELRDIAPPPEPASRLQITRLECPACWDGPRA
jgi:hypothetical protein